MRTDRQCKQRDGNPKETQKEMLEIKNSVTEMKNTLEGDFPGGPVVKNPPSNPGDVSSIPGQGTKVPHATEPECHNQRSLVLNEASTKTQRSQKNKIKNTFEGLTNRLDMVEERISELEEISVEASKTEKQKEQKLKLEQWLPGTWGEGRM